MQLRSRLLRTYGVCSLTFFVMVYYKIHIFVSLFCFNPCKYKFYHCPGRPTNIAAAAAAAAAASAVVVVVEVAVAATDPGPCCYLVLTTRRPRLSGARSAQPWPPFACFSGPFSSGTGADLYLNGGCRRHHHHRRRQTTRSQATKKLRQTAKKILQATKDFITHRVFKKKVSQAAKKFL